jgi:hypothetical protein
MYYKINCLIAMMIFFVVTSTAYGQDWLWKITPLQTNISEVKKMFDITPEIYGNDQLKFIFEDGHLTIGFSPDKCVKTSWGAWNIAKGTVIDIDYFPYERRKPLFYNLKRKEMKQGYDRGIVTYSSDESGLYYSTEFGKVTRINIYPPNKYNDLKCK